MKFGNPITPSSTLAHAAAMLALLFGGIPALSLSPSQATTPPNSTGDTGRHASYRLVSYELVERPKPSKGSYQARIVLSDGYPSPVAWLTFWAEADFNPEEHWNREADLERCPKCHPQYELHFQMKDFPATLKTLHRLGGKARLSYQNDQWTIGE